MKPIAFASALFLLAPAGLASESASQEIATMAEGPGREPTHYACLSCHSIQMVTQQALRRERRAAPW